MPSFLPIPVEIQRRHGGECESTRAMNLANRPREIVDRGGGSSMIAATIVHNFHGERGGGRSTAISFFRSRIGYSNGNDSRVSRILEEFLFSPPPSPATFRTCSIPLERGRRRGKGGRSGCIDPDAEIPDLHRASGDN